MPRLSPCALSGGIGLVLVLLLSGCSADPEKGVVVRGKLLRGGEPAQVELKGKQLPPGESGRMKVMFYPVKGDKDAIVDSSGSLTALGGEQAEVAADGTFQLRGGKGKGIPPGKYRVVITHTDPFTSQDLLKGMFSEARSRITREVTAESPEIVIDLAKPNG